MLLIKQNQQILLNNTYIKEKQDSNDYQEPGDIYINLPKLYSNEIDIYFFIPDYTLNKLYPNNRHEINVPDYRGDVSGCIYYEIYDSHDTVVSSGNKNFEIDNSVNIIERTQCVNNATNKTKTANFIKITDLSNNINFQNFVSRHMFCLETTNT